MRDEKLVVSEGMDAEGGAAAGLVGRDCDVTEDRMDCGAPRGVDEVVGSAVLVGSAGVVDGVAAAGVVGDDVSAGREV